MKSLVPFFIGVLITCLIIYFSGSDYVNGITDEYKDSLNNQRLLNALKIDSFNLRFDSLSVEEKKTDTILIKIYKNEKITLALVDSTHDTNLVSSIKRLLHPE